MSTRRVVIGLVSGVELLRCSSTGFDVLTDPDDGVAITFDSSWSDIAKIHSIGVLTGVNTSFSTFTATWADPGFKPFLEYRRLSAGVLNDDWINTTNQFGLAATITNTGFSQILATTSDQLVYVAYKVAIPSG